jgi:hypothetical protein
MAVYRVYFLNKEGHVDRPPLILEHCADDDTAIEAARRYVDGLDIEIWDGPRLVAKLGRSS